MSVSQRALLLRLILVAALVLGAAWLSSLAMGGGSSTAPVLLPPEPQEAGEQDPDPSSSAGLRDVPEPKLRVELAESLIPPGRLGELGARAGQPFIELLSPLSRAPGPGHLLSLGAEGPELRLDRPGLRRIFVRAPDQALWGRFERESFVLGMERLLGHIGARGRELRLPPGWSEEMRTLTTWLEPQIR